MSNGSSSSSNALGISMDSPRMNSSGKVVFQSLERSSSSPSTFNGGPRVKYKGMERRSYSANVKVSPVLNVPVCSLRGSSKFGLGQLFPSPHKKSGGTSSTSIDFSSEKARSSHVNKQKPSSSSSS
ncbi:serine/arginine repetitive matrix-like protein [Thalictrum thalictroides]|uniref:Serine/arginine repetitive matrix-like protein n=1 Tax=Thalictrum thalictroides TaxID=46969 RepID=A0A7J6W8J7_THATH|nr:serine/arginine repetitive matrix-like protein [Thalictrum thalictroides]